MLNLFVKTIVIININRLIFLEIFNLLLIFY